VADRIAKSEGRRLFGSDPSTYDLARPGHAELVYEVLVARCGLRPGSSVLEVGPGTGQATRRLLDLGADPLVALEPDPALADYLRASTARRVDVRVVALEDAEVRADEFDLAAAASSFHWVDEDVGLRKIRAALRPGGWWAMWWTLFGEGRRKDAFMKAVDPLLENLPSSPSSGWSSSRPAFALDVEARSAALARAGFVEVQHEITRWDAAWDSKGIRGLYSTFSPIRKLDDGAREKLLDEIAAIAERDFDGRIERTLATSLYIARKPT
jgi:SAM-dependent methyltransferase